MDQPCPSCNASNPAETLFCSSCGHQIRSALSRGSGPISLGRVLTSAPEAPTHHVQVGIAAPVGQVESVAFAKPVAVAESVALAEPMAQVEAITLPEQPTDPFEDVHKPAVFEHIGVFHTDPGVPVAPAEPVSLTPSIDAQAAVDEFEAVADAAADADPHTSTQAQPPDSTADTDAPPPYDVAQLMAGSTPVMSLEELLARARPKDNSAEPKRGVWADNFTSPYREHGDLPTEVFKLSPDTPATLGTNPRGIATVAVIMALIGLGFVTLVIMVLEKRSAFLRFHAMQAFLLAAINWVTHFMLRAMGAEELIFLPMLVIATLLVVQAVKAYSGGILRVPLLSDLAEALSSTGRA